MRFPGSGLVFQLSQETQLGTGSDNGWEVRRQFHVGGSSRVECLVGRAVERVNDAALCTGRGRFADDM